MPDDREKTQSQLPEGVGTGVVPGIEGKCPEELQAASPDGGINAWLCVLGSFFCQMSSFGFITA